MSYCFILSWNVRSILSEEKLSKFLTFIDDQHAHICCITETWFDTLNGVHTKSIKDAGFEVFHCFRTHCRGGGVAILYKKTFSVKRCGASVSEFSSLEFTCISIKLGKSKFCLLCIYRKGEISFNVFFDELKTLMKKTFSKCDILVVMGDFNIWVEVKSNKNAKTLFHIMSSFGLSNIVEGPTHEDGHTLDLVFVNTFQLDVKCDVLNDLLDCSSDHFPVIFEIPRPDKKDNARTVTFRNTKNTILEDFKEDMVNACQYIKPSDNFVPAFQKFVNLSYSIINKHAPIVKKTFTDEKTPLWMDQEYKESRRERRRLECKWKRKRTNSLREQYMRQREFCVLLAQEKKRNYYSQLITNSNNCQKTLFKLVDTMLDRKSGKPLPSYTNAKQLADEFNKFYIEKVRKIRNSIPNTPRYFTSAPFQGEKLTSFTPVTEDELAEIIKTSGIKTSIDDPIPASFLKQIYKELLPTYVNLINSSFIDCSIDGVKKSVIDPLLKNTTLDHELYKSYRPITNLVFFSKLIERVVLRRLNTHISTNALHNDTQFAYKKYHSIETMAIGLVDELLKEFDSNKCTVVLFFDLSAAFDTLDINLLLTILQVEIGVDDSALAWIQSFLSNRMQTVRIEDAFSDSLSVLFGVPQGSVLGPFLFTVYVRSQQEVFRNCRFKSSSFADDSNGRKSFAITFQYDNLTNQINNCLKEVTSWMSSYFLKGNPDKTEIMVFCPKSLCDNVLIKGVFFENDCIRFSDTVKNIGIWFDQCLNFERQINAVVSHSYK